MERKEKKTYQETSWQRLLIVVHLLAVMLFLVLVSVIGPPVIAIAVCGPFDVVMSMLYRKKKPK